VQVGGACWRVCACWRARCLSAQSVLRRFCAANQEPPAGNDVFYVGRVPDTPFGIFVRQGNPKSEKVPFWFVMKSTDENPNLQFEYANIVIQTAAHSVMCVCLVCVRVSLCSRVCDFARSCSTLLLDEARY
jgi:hypothetical protein